MQSTSTSFTFRFFSLLLLLATTFGTVTTQTTLGAGDVAFTLLNLEGNNTDAFGFVLLTEVTAGTVVNVTDREYVTGTGFPEATEGVLTITFDQAFGCGTEVFIIDGDPANDQYVFESSVAGISVTAANANGFQLSTAGETLVMFQGTNLSNPCNDCFVTALANTGVSFGMAATGSGDLPPGLTVGLSAMAMSADLDGNEWDNIKYDCATAQADPADLRAAIMLPANWQTDNDNPLPTTACGFACSAVCLTPVIDSVTVVDCPGGPFATAGYRVHGQLNGAAGWEWRVPNAEGQACGDQNTVATGEQIFVFNSNPQWVHYVVAVGGCIAEEVCFAYVPNEELGQPTFAPLPDVCETAGIQTGLGGGMPTGGVYSGTGVTDDGNGMTFSFDPSVAGPGTVNVVYFITISGNTACAGSMSFANQPLDVLGGPALDTGSPVFNVTDGVQTGLGGGTPTGGVYSGAGVTDDANGMTYSFDPAVAGVGVTTVTYTVNDGGGCDGSAVGSITVEAPAPANNECPGATDLNALFGQPVGEAQTSGIFDNNDASTEASDPTTGFECFGEPDGGGASPRLDNTLWFTFTGDGETYVITTVECMATDYIDDGDTQIAIYTGDCGNLTGVACNEDAPGVPPAGPYPSQVTFPTEAGVVYRMLIDGFSSPPTGYLADGEFCVQVTRSTDVAVTNVDRTAIEIFPNPTTRLVNLSGVDAHRIEVFDHTGRLVATQTSRSNRVDLNGQPTGVYLLKIYTEETVYSAKVLKK